MKKKRKAQPKVSRLMRELSAYVSGALKRPLPEAVAEKTRHHVLDTIAAMVSGSRLLPGRKALSYARRMGGAKEACVIGSRFMTTVESAALVNGMAAHADETDDSHAPTLSHPGCAVVPAALALGEREGRAGQAMLRAVALGYDINCRVMRALDPVAFFQGGHTSHSFAGVFGAAAAAGALAGLKPDQVRYLFSYTAQQAAGVSCFLRDPDHVEKAFDLGGMPARNGVTAAMMAAQDFTGVDDVLSGERNFFFAHAPKPRPAEMIRALGTDFDIMTADIKKWPVGSPIQAPLESLRVLMAEHRIRAADVARLTVHVGVNEATYVDDRPQLTNNIQHMLAIMLIDGGLSFAACHDDDRARDREVMALKRRIVLVGSARITRARPRRQGIVEIATRDGRRLAHRTRFVQGTASNPMTRAELEEKCTDLMAPVLGTRRTAALVAAAWRLDRMASVRSLRPLLMA